MTKLQSENIDTLATWSTDLLLMLEDDSLTAAELATVRPPTDVKPARPKDRLDLFAARASLRVSLERIASATTRLDDERAQWYLQRELPIAVCRFNAFYELLRSTE